MNNRYERSQERRHEKLAERKNLEQRKQMRDKRFRPIEDDELINDLIYDGEPYDESD